MKTTRVYSLERISKAVSLQIKQGQIESASVWNHIMGLHLKARTLQAKWPGLTELHLATKNQFKLHSQSVQGVIRAFIGNVETTTELRKQGCIINYPYKTKQFYPLIWPSQALKVKDSKITLPMGRGRKSLILTVPINFKPGSCRILWNGCHNELHVNSEIEEIEKLKTRDTERATVDLGQIHLAAVTTSSNQALIVSGRGIRSHKKLRNKMLKSVSKKQKKCKKYSRRWKKLLRAKRKHSLKQKRRIKDLRHKATKSVVNFCKHNKIKTLYVGDLRSVRELNNGRVQNQRISQWEVGKDIDYLTYKCKLNGIDCITGTERGTSSQCPICSNHQKSPKGRNWLCKNCGFHGHRDLVGSVNMHKLAFKKAISFPSLRDTKYLRPSNIGSSSSADTRHVATIGKRTRSLVKAKRRSISN